MARDIGDTAHPPIIWMGKNEYGRVEIWWTGEKLRRKKRSSKSIDTVSYALKVSVNGVKCVFVQAHFRSSGTHLKVCKLA